MTFSKDNLIFEIDLLQKKRGYLLDNLHIVNVQMNMKFIESQVFLQLHFYPDLFLHDKFLYLLG